MLVLAGVAALLILPFALLLVTRPVERHLALAQVRARPGRAALVVAAALLSTAIVTATLVVDDSFHASIRRSATDQLGPTDEVVVANGVDGTAPALADLDRGDSAIADTLPVVRLPVTALTTGFVPLADPGAHLVEVDFDRASRFGGDPAATGISGPTPSGTEAVVSRDLADRIGLRPGSRIRVYAYGAIHQLTVVRVLPRTGIAGLGGLAGDAAGSANVFVAPGTIAALVAQAGPAADAEPPQSILAVANRDGVAGTDAVTAALQAAVAGRPEAVQPVKQQILTRAASQSAHLTRVFAVLGLFSVVAAVLLVVGAFGLLVLDRGPSLGVLRAIGMRRSRVVAALAVEGWFYALSAAVLGAAVGMLMARGVVALGGNLFTSGESASDGPVFAARAVSIAGGFVIGLAVTLGAVMVAVARVGRGSPSRMRRGGDSAGAAARRPLLLVASIVVVVGAGALAARAAASTARLNPAVLVGGAVTLVVAAVGVVLAGAPTVAGMGRRRGRVSVRLGLGAAGGGRTRVALVVAAEAFVLFTLALLLTVSQLAGTQRAVVAARLGGNASVLVRSNPTNPLPPTALSGTDGIAGVAAATAVDATVARPGGPTQPVVVVGFDGDLAGHGSPPLTSRATLFASDDDVYRAVAADPTTVVVGADLGRSLVGGGAPAPRVGETVTVKDPVSGAQRELRVVGVAARGQFAGADHVLVARSLTDSLFGARATADLLYVTTTAGSNNDLTAAVINGSHLGNGTDARSFGQLASDELGGAQQFFSLLTAFVTIGAVAAIAALAVTMAQSVVERRRDIGVLRAIGVRARTVRRGVHLEAAAVATAGSIAGVAAALVAARVLTAGDAFGDPLPFLVPYRALAGLAVGTILAAMLAAALPARRAARLDPADARRGG